ncbi:MAG: hypothetical protein HDS13_07665 [Bacteroides sp.]|nr:hypothetical protein [Bacteroides sp.]MBD5339812.1 hypothetical protein [Bacteroides sp.]
MKKTTYRNISPSKLYSVRDIMKTLGYSRAFLLSKVSDKNKPLGYVIDEKTRMMKFQGSELIRYFHIKV